MSLVAEALAASGKLQKEDLSSKISKLSKKIDESKKEVLQIIDTRYVNFSPALSDTLQVSLRLGKLKKDIDDVTDHIHSEVTPQLESSTGEVEQLSQQFQEACLALSVAETLVNLMECLDSARKALTDKDYLVSASFLHRANCILNQVGTSLCDDLPIFHAIHTEMKTRHEALVHHLTIVWDRSFELQNAADHTTFLRITKPSIDNRATRSSEVTDMVAALDFLGELNRKLTALGNALLKNFLESIMENTCFLSETERDSYCVLELKLNEGCRPRPENIISNVKFVFDFLDRCLFSNTVQKNEPATLMSRLGELIQDKFKELFITKCLAEAVPNDRKNLEQFNCVISDTDSFNKYLVEIGFFSSDDQNLIQYAKNVDILFLNKNVAHLLGQARQLMRQDFAVTVTLPRPVLQDEEQDTGTPLFALPACQVSETSVKLLELVREILTEACSSSDVAAARLFSTARNVMELYCDVIPTYHREVLAMLPQQAALLHNNCMYLSHHLLMLGHQYQSLISSLDDYSITFVDLVPRLRKLGTDHFLATMTREKNQLIDILRDGGGIARLVVDEALMPAVEKQLKQCIHQLYLLQRVWQHVLPLHVYLKAIGTLVNSVVEELITRVVHVEDIGSDSASQLISIMNHISDMAPPLFKVDGEDSSSEAEIHVHVRQWRRFGELLLVLGASMQLIVDRWTDGKGPLAHEFSPEEVKHLIRALFQNTDRRAAVLAKIK